MRLKTVDEIIDEMLEAQAEIEKDSLKDFNTPEDALFHAKSLIVRELVVVAYERLRDQVEEDANE